MKFLGFALLELNKATGISDAETARTYDITEYTKFGQVKKSNAKLNSIETNWGKLRMRSHRHAVMHGSEVTLISEEEFNDYLNRWNTAKVA